MSDSRTAGENARTTMPNTSRNTKTSETAQDRPSYVIYGDKTYLIKNIFASGRITCNDIEFDLANEITTRGQLSDKSLQSDLSALSPKHYPRMPVQNESERLRRSSPLQLIRDLARVAQDHGLDFFCALSFETAHIFEDLPYPQKPFALFLMAKTKVSSEAEIAGLFPNNVQSHFRIVSDNSDQFSRSFSSAREHFRVGDIFEIVLSRRFEFECPEGNAYEKLAGSIVGLKAPYRFAINFPGTQLIGASPELLVHVDGRTVTNRPISGSMRRENSSTTLSDSEKVTLAELYASEKEKSELDMLVDLARHDLHRICSDVSVSAYRDALILETVVHTQSTVTGTLRDNYDALDAVFSCLNAGTLVGAPKKKAMEIIRSIEGIDREFYGGNLLHITPDGNLKATILIRTFQLSGERVTLQAGATVLYESREDYEFWECGAKAKGLLECVGHSQLATGSGPPPKIDSRSGPDQASFSFLRSFREALATMGSVPVHGQPLRLLLIDNHDSFTFNLAALFEELGCEVVVVRNDMDMPPSDDFDACVLSPGPSSPRDAGQLVPLTRAYWNSLPLFGVCLGFQAMIEALDGELGVLPAPVHGKVSSIQVIHISPLLAGVPEKFSVGRYHSLYGKVLPRELTLLCEDEQQVPMAFESRVGDLWHCGVQFHPESFLSGTAGTLIARNWLAEVAARRSKLPARDSSSQAQNLARAILEEEPSIPFLQSSLHNLNGRVLAELTVLLRKQASIPENLKDVTSTIKMRGHDLLEVCGTGGTKSHRLNTSTLTALYAAAAGHCVVKHGGRSASGHKGSLDLLEHLELEPAVLFTSAAEHLRTLGLSYLGAQFTFGAFGRYASSRKAFGKPSLFNLLGPLLNPILPSVRILGCFGPEVFSLLADTLSHLKEDGVVIYSRDADGLIDEVNPCGFTSLAIVREGRIVFSDLSPVHKLSDLLDNQRQAHTDSSRQRIFEDGLAASKAVLDATDSQAGLLGKAFIVANLSLVQLMTGPYRSRGIIPQQEFEDIYYSLWGRFDTLASKARSVIASMKANSGTDPRSPLAGIKPEGTVLQRNKAPFTSTTAAQLGARSRKLFELPSPLFIAEIKKRTPLKSFAPLSIEDQVRIYESAGAHAMSVVTHPLFEGSLNLLSEIRALSTLPILAKDFISDTASASELIDAGADAILLLKDWLEEERVQWLSEHILSKGALPVVESTWRPPGRNWPIESPRLELINARNLFSLRISERYRIELARDRRDAIIASHLSSPSQAHFASLGHRGVLVGEALMTAGPGGTLDFITQAGGHPQHPLLKACGAQTSDDVMAAVGIGYNLIGLNLIPSSKRALRPEELQSIFKDLTTKVAAGELSPWIWSQIVLLTSPFTPREHIHWLSKLDPICLRLLREQPYGMSLLRLVTDPESSEAIRILAPLSDPAAQVSRYGAELFVLESSAPGSGVRGQFTPCSAINRHRPVLLAGGISASNVGEQLADAQRAGWWIVGFDAATHIARDSGVGFCQTKLRSLKQASSGLSINYKGVL